MTQRKNDSQSESTLLYRALACASRAYNKQHVSVIYSYCSWCEQALCHIMKFLWLWLELWRQVTKQIQILSLYVWHFSFRHLHCISFLTLSLLLMELSGFPGFHCYMVVCTITHLQKEHTISESVHGEEEAESSMQADACVKYHDHLNQI